MGFTASDAGGGNFKRVPAGAFIGRCFSLIDLGTQESNGQYGMKMQHKIRIGFELFGEDEEGQPLTVEVNGETLPMTISKSYTVSLHEKASLRKDLAAWRGKDFSEEEAKAFDVSKLLGAYGMVNVTTSESNGKTYSNIAGLTPLPSALRKVKPEPVLPDVVFDLDKPDMKVFAVFHEKLQEAIKKSPEWARNNRSRNQSQEMPPENDFPPSDFDDSDDIPF
jgi:CO dehydrogenase/acetyl-CoA synthase delta subunit